MDEADELRRGMVGKLTDKGDLLPVWRDAFLSVPRHEFIPDVVWQYNGSCLVPLHRDDDPQARLKLCYDDEFIITQVDDGNPVGPGLIGSMITSSASMPTMVAIMLGELDVESGHRVLEIGTGTGYNAALLAYRLGASNVTTVEIDAALAAQAEQSLKRTGFGDVTVVAGDGEEGYPGHAPYDRVISTADAARVPYAWVEQTRPGGRIVTPWSPSYDWGAVLVLTVRDGIATGGIVGPSSFMSLRGQRVPRSTYDTKVYDVSETDVHPYNISVPFDACMAIGIRVPRCRFRYWPPDDEDDSAVAWLADPWSQSWAKLIHYPRGDDDPPYEVRQHGSRRLWDEVEAAYHWWVAQGSPTADRWRFTITADEQRIIL